jgi:hypothetical protein
MIRRPLFGLALLVIQLHFSSHTKLCGSVSKRLFKFFSGVCNCGLDWRAYPDIQQILTKVGTEFSVFLWWEELTGM